MESVIALHIIPPLIAFIFGISDDVVFSVEIGHHFLTTLRKDAASTFTDPVLRMLIAFLFQECVKIFFPQPCTIKQDAIDFIFIMTIFYFFMTKNLQTKSLQIPVFAEIRVMHRTQILVDDFSAVILVVGRSDSVEQIDSLFGVFVIG